MIEAGALRLLRRNVSSEAFERDMRESHRKVYSLALRLTGNISDAEDLVQEAYVRAYRFYDRYDQSLPFASWMYRIVSNAHIDAVRRKQRIRSTSLESANAQGTTWEFADDSHSPEKNLINGQVNEFLELGLMAMSPDFRTAVILADVEGMAYEEIAEIMETSIGTVRSRIHRGRKQLREYIKIKNPDLYRREMS